MDWFTPEKAGLIGALLGGGVCGVLLGGIGGGVCAPLAAKGRGRALVMPFIGLLVALGVGMLATAIVALAAGQPYHVWYAFLLPGVLGTALSTMMVFIVRRAYRQHDSRRLAAEEIRRG